MYRDLQSDALLQAERQQQTDGSARNVYFSLNSDTIGDAALTASRAYLARQLDAARELPSDLPADMHGLSDWIDRNTEQVGRQYRDYLDARKAGGPRRYFGNKSHALHFLKGVAPTKLVDGSWLYGVLARWNDARFASLIRIYLEELGDGVPTKNHVVLYRELLAAHGCEQWDTLSDDHFTQGAIQLALAHHAGDFLPE